MFKLTFNTDNAFENAWHESDWCIEFGYFSTQELAKQYIEDIFKSFEVLDAKRNRLSQEISDIQDSYSDDEWKNMSEEDRTTLYNNDIKPRSDAKALCSVRREFYERKYYIITEITPETIDKPFVEGVVDFVMGPW